MSLLFGFGVIMIRQILIIPNIPSIHLKLIGVPGAVTSTEASIKKLNRNISHM